MKNKILFLGDYFYDYLEKKKDIMEISKFIKKNNYVCILNLEAPLTSMNSAIFKRGPNLQQSKISVSILKDLNVIGVTLANNHIMDFGLDGLKECIKILNDNDIAYCGAGVNLYDALIPMQITLNSKKIFILNFGWDIEETVYAKNNKPGCAPKNRQLIIDQINFYKKQCDVLICIMHWGYEFHVKPMPYDINLAHDMIDNGVQLIIGHHPHNIQSYEMYKGRMIFYSLGNFYFSSRRKTFANKKFNLKLAKRCDFGLGVIFDVDRLLVDDCVFFKYDIEFDVTSIETNNYYNTILMDDISNIIYNSNVYINEIKKSNINPKPIFTTSSIINILNIIKLKGFVFPYKNVRRFIGKLIKKSGGKHE